MKKLLVLFSFSFIVFNLFSYEDSDAHKRDSIRFSGLSFSNITSVDSGATKNEQLFGWHTSAIKERRWGDLYTKFGIMYNISAEDSNGVIGIPFPLQEEIDDLDSDTLYFPTKRGYAFRPKISETTEMVLVPSIGVGFLWTDIEYETNNTSSSEYTMYEGYMIGFDMSIGFDVSMMHRFSNMYLRYGVEVNMPLFQLTASRMKKQESEDGVYYGSALKASSNDFIGIDDVFKFEASPYIAIGFRLNTKYDGWFEVEEIESIAVR